MTTTISPDNFPTPDLALRSAGDAEERRVRGFASAQAAAAEAMRVRLAAEWQSPRSWTAKVRALRAIHTDLVQWRYELARQAPGRLGKGIALEPERFRSTLEQHGPNYDRIGYIGRMRVGATWDEGSRTFRGGKDTPAHRIMLVYGAAAIARFARCGIDGDVLQNQVRLPDGRRMAGNSLLRGAAAQRIAEDLVKRIAKRGADTSQIETGGEPIYVVSAEDDARTEMFRMAMELLATAEPGDVAAWQQARYLLYQAPTTKKGSDAVTRTFLVTVGAVLLGQPPTLEHDVDLRCAVLGQDEATTMPSDPEPTRQAANQTAASPASNRE